VKRWMPSGSELAREALIVLGGALLAALVVGQFPALKAWIQEQWKGTQ
jgi:hypothetical protein